jgi:hypothetical protein
MERAELCVKALEGIEDPMLFVSNAKEMFKHSTVMQLNAELFNFISEVAEHKRPLLTKLASVDAKGTVVSVWAGIGISNPIMRIKEIKNQKDALRDLLIRVKNSDFVFSDSDKLNAQILIDTFI